MGIDPLIRLYSKTWQAITQNKVLGLGRKDKRMPTWMRTHSEVEPFMAHTHADCVGSFKGNTRE